VARLKLSWTLASVGVGFLAAGVYLVASASYAAGILAALVGYVLVSYGIDAYKEERRCSA
jgi:hypothetical protein